MTISILPPTTMSVPVHRAGHKGHDAGQQLAWRLPTWNVRDTGAHQMTTLMNVPSKLG